MMDWLSKVIDCGFPRTSAALVRRLLIIPHCSSQGHRGHNAMIAQLNKVSQLSKSRVHPDRFLSRCLLCLHVKAGELYPGHRVPHFEVKHATKHYILIFFLFGRTIGSHGSESPKSELVTKLGNKTPLELFTGLPPPSPFAHACLQRDGGDKFVTLPSSNAIERSLAQLRENARRPHCEVSCAREKQTLLSKTKHRGEKVVKFSGEVYVLRSHGDVNRLNWLLVTWVEPYMITEAHPRYFVVKDIISGQGYGIHASRLKCFADFDLEVSEELFDHVAAPGMVMKVKEIKNVGLVR
ncbi:hypothetical protein PHMEG_00021636 [Phytophthora megakarya]|uniref:Uncharacterized protein n=1 Tax=Phytophthora megakarya TaxID=4795 RepID=A0A225VNN7_9STRA|nr:hypothetical protein PHMEG_00021636 [Phytophthora megakarya]